MIPGNFPFIKAFSKDNHSLLYYEMYPFPQLVSRSKPLELAFHSTNANAKFKSNSNLQFRNFSLFWKLWAVNQIRMGRYWSRTIWWLVSNVYAWKDSLAHFKPIHSVCAWTRHSLIYCRIYIKVTPTFMLLSDKISSYGKEIFLHNCSAALTHTLFGQVECFLYADFSGLFEWCSRHERKNKSLRPTQNS